MKTVEKIHRETDGTVQSLVRALRLLAVPFRFGIPAEPGLCTLPVRVSPRSFAVEFLK